MMLGQAFVAGQYCLIQGRTRTELEAAANSLGAVMVRAMGERWRKISGVWYVV